MNRRPTYRTALGEAWCADARDQLARLPDGCAALVLTSPPFPLRRRKAYGNVDGSEYVEWFMPFAQEIHRVLRGDGSAVIELGGCWEAGGRRSLYQYELILRLDEFLHPCQEFYWHNPSKLPTPAEWVTVRRTRVKDAVYTLWWLSKGVQTRADNRRVLQPYKASMRRLLNGEAYRAPRPSKHILDTDSWRDNGGSIPSNLLNVAHSRSNDPYLKACKRKGLPIHPCRWLPEIPEFFVRFLTQEGDLVIDPFAGSNVVGRVCEDLGRRWLSIERDPDYVRASQLRFEEETRD